MTIPARVPDSNSRLGDLRDPAAGRRRARPDAGGAEGGRHADARSTTRSRCTISRPTRAAHDGAALPVSEDLATRILALPIHPDLTEADVDRVCAAVLANV